MSQRHNHIYSFLSSVVEFANKHLGENIPVHEKSLFFSYIYALIALRGHSGDTRGKSLSSFEKEANLLSQFPVVTSAFVRVKETLSETLITELLQKTGGLELVITDCDNTISWLYQSLKKTFEKEAFGKIGKQGFKISGKDALFTTQFFTDEYMVKYLVNKCITECEDNIRNTVFIDPALGGGNFLSYVFVSLYEWYSSHTDWAPSKIAEYIINKQIVGYDLDETLPEIARLSLYLNVYGKAGDIDLSSLRYFGGISGDIYGFVNERITSTIINRKSFCQCWDDLIQSDKQLIYVTNPPFMGKRDMDLALKSKLKSLYPQTKGDLCFSFMNKILENLRGNDILALVCQNGWMNLSSLKGFRGYILHNHLVKFCADLGSNSFYAISGEKTNVVLAVFTNGVHSEEMSTFYNLRSLKYKEKESTLSNLIELEKKSVCLNQSVFLSNPDYAFTYELNEAFASLSLLPQYAQYGKPMQGSSTGDNEHFVKYIWEPVSQKEDWRLASKGGGFSKWQGLNIFKVKWGKNGECIANNKGSALRNLKEIPLTKLVYSDTGTLGLNVRCLLPDQVFIASGPGIKVLYGNPLCHMAFLNSKIAGCLLKIKNPKFTISAGYIGQLPVPQAIFQSQEISTLAENAIALKKRYLLSKLPNSEFKPLEYDGLLDLESYIHHTILDDLQNQFERLQIEQRIDSLICNAYSFNDAQLKILQRMTGCTPTAEKRHFLEEIDRSLSGILTESCVTISRKLPDGFLGSENAIEILAHQYNCNIMCIFNILRKNVENFPRTIEKYKRDLVHKLILSVCGAEDLTNCSSISVSPQWVLAELCERYPQQKQDLQIDTAMVVDTITNTHSKCFFGKPIITLE